MFVSVVIPLFNKGPHIVRCLESVASQTLADFEVVVVDDGSTDEGATLARRFPDDRVRVISQKNSGPGHARNRGVDSARGDLVAFLDADDEWLPSYLAESVRLLTDHPEAATVSSGYFEMPGGLPTENMWRDRGIRSGLHRLEPETAPMLAVHMLAYMSPWSTVVRMGAFRKHGGFYERNRCLYGEDAFLWLKVLLNEPVLFNMEPVVRYHRDASQLSGNLAAPRPVEPFLSEPEEIEACCPEELKPLLTKILAIRAYKTACVLGLWGRRQRAGDLRRRFRSPGMHRLPYFWSSLICASPVGATLGRILYGLR
ncbi:glycosyltransferase family 2 protein [Microvirga sp. M2]|uniref:glycosyltransferase family 2 protein n=1 Tax=Microvirga sp. M2 TaxID=3073270 RepID=UPI0039C17662